SNTSAQGLEELRRRFTPANFRADDEMLQPSQFRQPRNDGTQTVIVVRRHAQHQPATVQLVQDEAGVCIAAPCLGAPEMLVQLAKAGLPVGDVTEPPSDDAPPASLFAFLAGPQFGRLIERLFFGEGGGEARTDLSGTVPAAEALPDVGV